MKHTRCTVCGGPWDTTRPHAPLGDLLCYHCHEWAQKAYQRLVWRKKPAIPATKMAESTP